MDLGQKTGRVRLQGQTKDVYQAEIKVKEILHNIKTELKEQQDRILLAQFVSISAGNRLFYAIQHSQLLPTSFRRMRKVIFSVYLSVHRGHGREGLGLTWSPTQSHPVAPLLSPHPSLPLSVSCTIPHPCPNIPLCRFPTLPSLLSPTLLLGLLGARNVYLLWSWRRTVLSQIFLLIDSGWSVWRIITTLVQRFREGTNLFSWVFPSPLSQIGTGPLPPLPSRPI